MDELEAIILDVVYDKKIVLKEKLIEIVSLKVSVEKNKIERKIQKLLDEHKIYRFEETYISLLGFGDKLEENINEKLKCVISKDFLFKNPLLDNGRELCDNLIFFNGVLIMIQAKTAKYDSGGGMFSDPSEFNYENFEKFSKKTFDEGSKQLKVSINRVERNDFTLEAKNEKGKLIRINRQDIKRIHGVVVVYFPLDETMFVIKSNSGSDYHFKNIETPRQILTYDELLKLLLYFSTITDLIDYLDKRGSFVLDKRNRFIQEEDIIALYYSSNRTMNSENTSDEKYKESVVLYTGFTEYLESGELGLVEKFREKARNNHSFPFHEMAPRQSFHSVHLKKHSGLPTFLQSRELKKQLYKKANLERPRKYVDSLIKDISELDHEGNTEFLKELEKLRSFNRRMLGETIADKINELEKSKKNKAYLFHKIGVQCGVVLCFLKEDEEVGNFLINACATAKAKLNLKKVFGMYTILKPERIYGFVHDTKEYSEEERRKLLKYYGDIWSEPKQKNFEEFN